ncbi:hypothetical protein HYDPIDRAFT_94570 [Hydnomerulius pinastri MD-312]|uniref:Uncharacterized protein n=1 Tax=Hydnomerulius pinastri MD-312 TaxID=994086 RepID=A0A0C9UYF5_9AGAM|nr:hypothetical protein HYDPIDRAFT_103327 [Hydnomerulius pinastri MD-312]KIJ62379.1 hypothetical protein HYDPIDRAFT_94570 [Hydnomerulius pinastri MD-312]
MNGIIRSTRSNDATRLKTVIGHYAAPDPSKAAISPPIYNGSAGRSHMGLNHPVLARYICPIEYLDEFDTDPAKTRKKLASGKLDMKAQHFPAVLWSGSTPGDDYQPENMHHGLFKGFLLVMRHIFLGPSTALGEDSRATRSCNAVLHDMTTVEPEHIAYACVQVASLLSCLPAAL